MRKAVVLGGTSPHVVLIEKLKSRGFYTVLVDYLDNSPGIAHADKHIRESTLDVDKVCQIAEQEKADLVISTCIDQANSTCCYVAEKLGLPRPYDYQTSLNVTDKGLMKKIMTEHGIPTSGYIVVKSEGEINWEQVCFPAVVKPVDCNSSKGVHRVDSREETVQYVAEALRLSRTHHAIIEGFNEGAEIQVDCFAAESGASVLMTRQKKTIKASNGMVLQSTGSVIPAPLTRQLEEQARRIADQIAEAFGLHNTPFFYQAIVTASGISVLEFAPRIGGGLSYYLIKTVTGVDIVDAAIDSFLGNPVQVRKHGNPNCYSTNLLYMKPGVFDHLDGLAQLKRDGVIKEFFQMKKSGTEIDSDLRSGNRVGAFVIEGAAQEEVARKEREAYAAVRVVDDAGKDLLNRDIIEY